MKSGDAYLLKMLDQIRMLIRDVLLDERGRFEELLAVLAPELALVLLLDVLFASSREFPALREHAIIDMDVLGTYSS